MPVKKYTKQDGVFVHEHTTASIKDTPRKEFEEGLKKALQKTADQNTSAYILKKLKLYALARLEISGKKQDDRQRQDCKKILEKTEFLAAIIARPETSQDFLYTQFYDLGLLAQRADIRPLEPSVFRGIKYSKDQASRRDKRQTWKSLTKAERDARDDEIVKDYNQSHAKNPLFTENIFCKTHHGKYNLSVSTCRNILRAARLKAPVS